MMIKKGQKILLSKGALKQTLKAEKDFNIQDIWEGLNTKDFLRLKNCLWANHLVSMINVQWFDCDIKVFIKCPGLHIMQGV